MTKQKRQIRKLMALGLTKKEALERLAHRQIVDWEQAERNLEIVQNTIAISQKLGQVTIPQ